MPTQFFSASSDSRPPSPVMLSMRTTPGCPGSAVAVTMSPSPCAITIWLSGLAVSDASSQKWRKYHMLLGDVQIRRADASCDDFRDEACASNTARWPV